MQDHVRSAFLTKKNSSLRPKSHKKYNKMGQFPNFFILFYRHLSEIWFWSLGVLFLSQKSWYHMILQVRFTFWWSLKFKKLNSFIFSWNEVGRRNFNFVTWKIKKFRKLATGHSRNYLVTIGNLGYLKLVKSDMYPKFLEINLVVVVRHSVRGFRRRARAGWLGR